MYLQNKSIDLKLKNDFLVFRMHYTFKLVEKELYCRQGFQVFRRYFENKDEFYILVENFDPKKMLVFNTKREVTLFFHFLLGKTWKRIGKQVEIIKDNMWFETENFKLYDAFYASSDYPNGDKLFENFCEIEWEQFEEWVKENTGYETKDFYRIGRSSSVVMIPSNLVEYNDKTRQYYAKPSSIEEFENELYNLGEDGCFENFSTDKPSYILLKGLAENSYSSLDEMESYLSSAIETLQEFHLPYDYMKSFHKNEEEYLKEFYEGNKELYDEDEV